MRKEVMGYGVWVMGAVRTLLIFIIYFFIPTDLCNAEFERATIAQAEKAFLDGRYNRAEDESKTLINARSSQRDELYYIKGLSQLKLNKYNKARDSFEYLVSRFPNSRRAFDACIGIGDSYFLEGDTSKALLVYNDVLGKFPDNGNTAIVYYRIGSCYKKAGQYDKAAAYFDKVKKLSPLSFEARMTDAGKSSPLPVKEVLANPPERKTEGNGSLSVQVGSFKKIRNAENVTRKLAIAGYDSYMERPRGSGDGLYRVRVGRYRSREEAEAAAKELKKRGYSTRICSGDVCQ